MLIIRIFRYFAYIVTLYYSTTSMFMKNLISFALSIGTQLKFENLSDLYILILSLLLRLFYEKNNISYIGSLLYVSTFQFCAK